MDRTWPFGVQNVLGEFESVPGNPGIWNIVEVIRRVTHLVRVAQRGADNALAERLQHQQAFAPVEHDASNPDEALLPHGFANDRECLVGHLAVGNEVIGSSR